jgi:hypothetical protein
MNNATFTLESYSTHSYASKYGEVDVMWSANIDSPIIEEIVEDGCLDDAHDDFVRHVVSRCNEFCGDVFVRSDITGKYEKIV